VHQVGCITRIFHELNLLFNPVMNAVFVWYGCSKIFELFHPLNEFITYLDTVILSCIFSQGINILVFSPFTLYQSFCVMHEFHLLIILITQNTYHKKKKKPATFKLRVTANWNVLFLLLELCISLIYAWKTNKCTNYSFSLLCMVAPTCFGITLPTLGSISRAFREMLNWGAVDKILWMAYALGSEPSQFVA
jgi:hypothetical protein